MRSQDAKQRTEQATRSWWYSSAWCSRVCYSRARSHLTQPRFLAIFIIYRTSRNTVRNSACARYKYYLINLDLISPGRRSSETPMQNHTVEYNLVTMVGFLWKKLVWKVYQKWHELQGTVMAYISRTCIQEQKKKQLQRRERRIERLKEFDAD